MRCRNANACADALLHTFVSPLIVPSPNSAARIAPRTQARALSFLQPQRPILQLRHAPSQHRSIYRGQTGGVMAKPEKNRPPWDEEINSPYVNFVTADSKFFTKQPLRALLKTINRQEFRVVQLEPGNPELDDGDPKRWPTTKMMSIKELRETQAEKEKQVRRQQKGAKTKDGKVVEISWQIEPNDLQHRLGKLKEFLSQGKKVEVIMMNKARSKKEMDDQDRRELLQQIRRELSSVKGASERKVEGNVGKLMHLFWEIVGA